MNIDMNDPFGDIPTGNQGGQSKPAQTPQIDMNDPFGDIPTKSTSQQSQSPIDQHTQQIESSSNGIAASTMAFIDTFNKQMGDLPSGIAQLVGLGDYKVNGGMSVNEQRAQATKDAEIARINHPIAAGAGDVAGFIGNGVNAYALGQGIATPLGEVASAAAPGLSKALGAAGSTIEDTHPLLSQIPGSAAAGAAYGATQYVDPGQSRAFNTGAGALIGAAAPPALAAAKWGADEIAKPILGFANKITNPNGAALGDVVSDMKASGVTPDSYQAAIDAGNKVGVPLSLSEATQKDTLKTLDSGLKAAGPEQRAMYQEHMDAIAGLQPQVLKTIDNIVPEGPAASDMLKQGYKDLQNYTVPPEQMQQLQQLPAFNKMLEDINSNPYTKSDIAALPDNNVGKLEEINKSINLMTNKQSGAETADSLKARTMNTPGLNEVKNTLQPILSSSVPDGKYDALLNLAQRNAQRNGLIQDINKLKISTANPTKQFYDTLVGTPEKQDNFLGMIKNSGGDVNAAQSLIDTLGRVVNTPVQTIVKGTRVAAENSIKEANQEGIIKSAVEQITKGNYNKELFNLSLGGPSSQTKILNALSQSPLSDRIVGLHAILTGMKSLGPEGANIPVKAAIHNTTPDSSQTQIYRGIAPAILGGDTSQPSIAGAGQ